MIPSAPRLRDLVGKFDRKLLALLSSQLLDEQTVSHFLTKEEISEFGAGSSSASPALPQEESVVPAPEHLEHALLNHVSKMESQVAELGESILSATSLDFLSWGVQQQPQVKVLDKPVNLLLYLDHLVRKDALDILVTSLTQQSSGDGPPSELAQAVHHMVFCLIAQRPPAIVLPPPAPVGSFQVVA